MGLRNALNRYLMSGDRKALDNLTWDYIEYKGEVVGMMLVDTDKIVLEMRGCSAFIDKVEKELKLRKVSGEKHQYVMPVGQGLLKGVPVVVDDFSFPFKSPDADPCPLTVIQGGADTAN
jgi:hypothetical protein